MSKVYPVKPEFAAKARISKEDYERLYDRVSREGRPLERLRERIDAPTREQETAHV